MFDETPLVLVEDAKTLQDVAAQLAKSAVIGVDTEGSSLHHYKEQTSLVQISDAKQDYIIDPTKCDDMTALAPIFANPDIVKIFHGADYDVVSLKRDFGYQIVNIFDTMIAAQMIGGFRLGLADLVDRFFGITLDKQYQRYDWAKRPLLKEHLDYARGDSHFLAALRRLLTYRLNKTNRMHRVVEECKLMELREWSEPADEQAAFLRTKKSGTLDDTGKRVLRALYDYREKEAERCDRPPYKVLSGSVLIDASMKRPTDEQRLKKTFPNMHSMRRRFGQGIIKAINAGLADKRPIPTPQPKTKANKLIKLKSKRAETTFEALRDWRNDLIQTEGNINPVAVASNSVLRWIAQSQPKNLSELSQVPNIRAWQVKDYGEQILKLLNSLN